MLLPSAHVRECSSRRECGVPGVSGEDCASCCIECGYDEDTRRVDKFDFDIIVSRFGQSLSPGNEQRDFWGSLAADKEGSQNVMGIKNPAIDALIERVIFAKDRDDLVAATHALDRVLLAGHYVVPQFYSPTDRVASWDKFGRPEKMPQQSSPLASFLQVWWWDQAAAKKLDAARGR